MPLKRPLAEVSVHDFEEHYEVWVGPPCEGVTRFMVRLAKSNFLLHEAREVGERLWHVTRRYAEARRFMDEHPEVYGHGIKDS